MIFYAAKSTLPHQTREMTSAIRLLLIVLLAGVLAATAVACPLAIASCDGHAMPCHHDCNASNPCPVTLCQASSRYLASQNGTVHKVLLKEMPAKAVNPAFWRSPAAPNLILRNDGPLPGASSRVFLRLCSLLI
jgi:hypothetical protein